MRTRRLGPAPLCAAIILTLVAGVTAAVTGTRPAAAQESAIPSNTAPAYQTNGTVWSIVAAGGIVYVGGDFTSVRPPGAAAGTDETTRDHLAAFDATTGALVTSFNPAPNGSVRALAVSPDGSTVYAGGDFTTFGPATRNRLAAFSTATGALTSWAPSSGQRVSALAVGTGGVYVGGSFATISNHAAVRIADLDPTTGALVPGFSASADQTVYSLAVSTDGTRLYVAGAFTALDGDPNRYSAGALDATTGAELPFAAGAVIPRPGPDGSGCLSQTKVVRTDADGAYFGDEGTGRGCFDGTFAANADGSLKWVSHCLGATQAVQPLNGVLYTGAHTHDCSQDRTKDPNAFGEVGWARGLSRYLLSRSTANGRLGDWYPNTNGGTGLGPRVLATDGSQLFVGGEFTVVNGKPQQGFARFSPSTGDLAVPAQPVAPVAVARGGGRVSVYVQAPVDTDDPDLTINLYRDGDTTPIASKPVTSVFWRQPIVGFTDDDQASGSSHVYRAEAVETNGPNVGQKSAASNAVVVADGLPSYANSVLAEDPALYWRFDETHGPAVADSSDSLEGGTSFGGITWAQPGATDDSTAITTDGSSGIVSTTDAQRAPARYAVEAWFKTTTTTGGKIVGFGNVQRGYDFDGNPAVSNQYDRQIYMTNDGRLVFGVYRGGYVTLSTPTSYNDGAWHQVVGTQGPGGMALYVDGTRIGGNDISGAQSYTGYWRVGGDALGAWPDVPTTNYFAGSIDEVSVYDHPLSVLDVRDQYTASGRTPPPVDLPEDGYGRRVVQDGATTYWRLDETSGTSAADSSGDGDSGMIAGGVTLGGPSAINTTGNSMTFDGATGTITSTVPQRSPATYSEELWFNTTTRTGGKLLGFVGNPNGPSNSFDRHLYMTDAGRLVFGVHAGKNVVLISPARYNDGQWHQVVATQGADGMRLYVDDHLVARNAIASAQSYPGYWRAGGGDDLSRWPHPPTSSQFRGGVDEVAVYRGVALDASQIDDHYTLAGRTVDHVAPSTQITSPTDGAALRSGAVTVHADAADNIGVSAVDLVVDGRTVSSDSSAPWSFGWTATDGSHTLNTVAHDAAGNVSTSPDVHVSITTPDTAAPRTALLTPEDGASVYGRTVVRASANDNRKVASVALLVDGRTVATDTTAPYRFTWDATSSGLHTLRTVARDRAGNSGESLQRSVVVVPPNGTVLYRDRWRRAEGSTWRHTWNTLGGHGSVVTHARTGQLAVQDVPGASARARLTGVPGVIDSDLVTSYRWAEPTRAAYLTMYLRGRGGWVDRFRPRAGIGVQLASNSRTVRLVRVRGGVTTVLATVKDAQQVGTRRQWLRVQTVGTQLRVRIWPAGTAEPTAWTGTARDNAVTGAGQVYLALDRAASNTGAKQVQLDDVALTAR